MNSRAGIALGVALCACTLEGTAPNGDCDDAAPTGTQCCDPAVFARLTIPQLFADPGAHAGKRVEIGGVVDWYRDPSQPTDCVCTGGACSCPVPLGLRSPACMQVVRLGGSYGGRPVECSTQGCWPIDVGMSYQVCGLWGWNAAVAEGASPGQLNVEAFCPL